MTGWPLVGAYFVAVFALVVTVGLNAARLVAVAWRVLAWLGYPREMQPPATPQGPFGEDACALCRELPNPAAEPLIALREARVPSDAGDQLADDFYAYFEEIQR